MFVCQINSSSSIVLTAKWYESDIIPNGLLIITSLGKLRNRKLIMQILFLTFERALVVLSFQSPRD